MRPFFVALALFASPVFAQDIGVESVISDQMLDFRSGDVGGAYEHASPPLQRFFGSPESFGQMVRQGYPSIWANDGVRFFDLRADGDTMVQGVEVRDTAGDLHWFDYRMVRDGAGWRIDGVTPRKAPDLAV